MPFFSKADATLTCKSLVWGDVVIPKAMFSNCNCFISSIHRIGFGSLFVVSGSLSPKSNDTVPFRSSIFGISTRSFPRSTGFALRANSPTSPFRLSCDIVSL